MKKFLSLLVTALLAASLTAACSEPVQTTLEFDFLSRLLIIDAETLAALNTPADAEAAAHAHSAWLTETVDEICSPELMDELMLSRMPAAMLDGIESLCAREIHTEALNPDTSDPGRCKFTVLADAVFDSGESGTLTFFGRLTKDEAAGQITDLRINQMLEIPPDPSE